MTQQSMFREFRRSGLKAANKVVFDAFWAAYPARRPNPRAVAEVEFQKAIASGAAGEDLVRAAAAYAAECRTRGIGQDFIVHASTFLRQRRFQDYLATPGVAAVTAPAAPPGPAEPDGEMWRLLRGHLSADEFRRWIAPLAVVTWSVGDAAQLRAPSRFHRDWVRQQHAALLRRAMGVKHLAIDIAEDIRP